MSAHTCHAFGCDRTIPPRLFMCKRHWGMVPLDLQRAIWRTYERGQEVTKDPSAAYVKAAKAAQKAVAELEREAETWTQESLWPVERLEEPL
jgi:hypothetical protein